jgi:hypothetical protein
MGGQGGTASSPAPNKAKGKVVQVIRNDDEVSSDDDVSVAEVDEGAWPGQINGQRAPSNRSCAEACLVSSGTSNGARGVQ